MSEDQDLALDMLLDFFNAVDAGICAARQRIKEAKKVDDQNLNFGVLPWEDKKGEKGPFQQTSEKANQNSDLWKTLKAKLKEHSGFWQNQGFRYWNDTQREDVIDRRKIA